MPTNNGFGGNKTIVAPSNNPLVGISTPHAAANDWDAEEAGEEEGGMLATPPRKGAGAASDALPNTTTWTAAPDSRGGTLKVGVV